MSDATRQPCFYLPISRGQPPSPQQAPTAEAPELNSFGPERPIGVPCSKAMRGLAPAFLACPNGARRCIPIGQSGGEVISSWPACDSPMLLCSRTTSEFPGPSQASVGRVCPLFWGPRAWAEMSSGLGLSLWCRGKDHDLSAHTPLGDGVLTGAARLHINKLKAKPKRSSAEDTDHGARGIAHSFPILALKRSAFLLEVFVVRQSAIGPHFAVAPPRGFWIYTTGLARPNCATQGRHPPPFFGLALPFLCRACPLLFSASPADVHSFRLVAWARQLDYYRC